MATDSHAANRQESRLPDAYGGWNLAADEELDALGRVVKKGEGIYVCEHGYIHCEGCEECGSWAEEVLALGCAVCGNGPCKGGNTMGEGDCPKFVPPLVIGRRYRVTTTGPEGSGHLTREGKFIGVDRLLLSSGYAFTRSRKEGGVFVVPLDALEKVIEL